MKNLIKTAIALTAIGVAVRANRKTNEYKHFKDEYILLKKEKLNNQPL